MATFLGKVRTLLMTRIFHITAISFFLVVGASCANNTPIVKIEPYSSTVKGLSKIKVAVVVTNESVNRVEKFEVHGRCKMHGTGRRVQGVMRGSVNIGSATSKIFKSGFSRLFDVVDVYNYKQRIDKESYDLIIITDFTSSTSYDQLQALNDDPNFKISSKIILKANIFYSRNGQLITTLSSPFTYTGQGYKGGYCCVNDYDYDGSYVLTGDFSKLFGLAINKSFPRLLSQLENSLIVFAKTKHEQQTLPSSLTVDLIYSENSSFSSNNILDAAENCSIIATIKNKGNGTAFDVKLFTESQTSNINFPTSLTVGDILPGESKDVTIPLTTNLSLHTGTASFKIIAKEKRGYDSKTYNLNIQTANLKKPELFITNSKINDGNVGMAKGNGNGIPENGETIELIPFIKNKGVGRAIKVNLAINSINSGIGLIQKNIEIAEILPGQTVTGKLAFTIPRTYSGGDLKIDLVASDVRGASDDTRVVTLSTQSNRPMLTYSHRIIDGNGNNVLENGEEGYIEITPSNKGKMEARDISVNDLRQSRRLVL